MWPIEGDRGCVNDSGLQKESQNWLAPEHSILLLENYQSLRLQLVKVHTLLTIGWLSNFL